MIQKGRIEKPKRQRPRVAKEDRLRASKACLPCQRSKSRCIVESSNASQCSRCIRKALACLYSNSVNLESTSGPPPNTSLSPQVQRPPIDETALNDWVPLTPRDIERAYVLDTVSSARHGTVSHRRSIATASGRSDSRSASSISNGRILSRIREAMFLDPSTASLDKDMSRERYNPERVAKANCNQDLIRSALEHLPPKPVADFLCSSCFELGTDSFFYFNQPEFKHSLDELYTTTDTPLRQDCNFVCITLMTLALGSQFAHLKATNSVSSIHKTGHYPGLIFYKLARSLIPDVIANHCVEAVQACFIMSVYLLPAHAYDMSYFYMGLAVRVAIALDLHRDYNGPDLPAEVIEGRRRLWWSIYSLERTVSIKLGRPRSIDANDITTPLPTPMATIDNVQVLNNIYHQIANAELVKIMDRIAGKVPPTFNPKDLELIGTLESMQQELKEWKACLPPSLQMHGLIPRAKGYRTVIHLHQNYANAWIVLCRLPLLFLVRERLKKAFVDPNLGLTKDDRVHSLAGSCVGAARTMIELFKTLQQTQSLAKFSFTDFQGCSTATIVMLLHSILETISPQSPYVSSGLSCLRFMASGNDDAKVGVRFVEEFQTLAEEASTRIREDALREASTIQNMNEMMAYEAWLRKVTPPNTEQEETSGVLTLDTNLVESTTESEEAFAAVSPSHRSFSQNENVLDTNPEVGGEDDSQPLESDIIPLTETEMQYAASIPDLLPSNLSHFDESFILGLTGLDTLDFTDQTYWPY